MKLMLIFGFTCLFSFQGQAGQICKAQFQSDNSEIRIELVTLSGMIPDSLFVIRVTKLMHGARSTFEKAGHLHMDFSEEGLRLQINEDLFGRLEDDEHLTLTSGPRAKLVCDNLNMR